MPGADAEVPVEAAGGVEADLDDPGLAALAVHGDLPVPQVHVAAPRVSASYRIPATPRGGPRSPGTPRSGRRRGAARTRGPHRRAQPGQVPCGEDRDGLVGDAGRLQPGRGVGDLVLGGQPLEELLEGTVLVAGVRAAVAVQQPTIVRWMSCLPTCSQLVRLVSRRRWAAARPRPRRGGRGGGELARRPSAVPGPCRDNRRRVTVRAGSLSPVTVLRVGPRHLSRRLAVASAVGLALQLDERLRAAGRRALRGSHLCPQRFRPKRFSCDRWCEPIRSSSCSWNMVPVSEPRPDEDVIRVEAAPLNPSDMSLLFGGADMHTGRFADLAPNEVWATLLDEGTYLGSVSTFYRVLREAGETRERRAQATHPAAVKPELVATGPNQVYSWDITKLHGPAKWTYYHLYVILDIYSRYVVGWMVATCESAVLADKLIAATCDKQGITRGQLSIHADAAPR